MRTGDLVDTLYHLLNIPSWSGRLVKQEFRFTFGVLVLRETKIIKYLTCMALPQSCIEK